MAPFDGGLARPQNRPQKGSSSQTLSPSIRARRLRCNGNPTRGVASETFAVLAKLCPWIPLPILRCRSSPSGLAFIFPTDIPNADDR